jgi:hypothetical protein
LTTNGNGNPGRADSALSLSSGNVAFIGGIVLETRKRITSNAILSLKSEYEYYSWVPEMAYNQQDTGGGAVLSPNGRSGTHIGSDDAFSMRTSLRLTVELP